MLEILRNIAAFVVALGILVAIHEYGHFWVARRCGVFVERFSIGFGKVLWRKMGKDGTEYVIAAIPMGGYVKMLDERVDDVPKERLHLAFNRKPVLARIAIVAAGPIANFLFAVFAFWLMFIIGISSVKPILGDVTSGSVVASSGLQAGDEIVAIDNVEIKRWQDVNMALFGLIGHDSSTISVIRDGNTMATTYAIDLRGWSFDPEKESPITTIGIVPYQGVLVVASIEDGSAAQVANLQAGDTLLSINGKDIKSGQTFVTIIKDNHGTSVDLVYQRNGNKHATILIPVTKQASDGTKYGYAGVGLTPSWPDKVKINLNFGPLDAIVPATEKAWQLIVLSTKMIGKLLTGELSVKNLSGPISIAQGAGNSASYGVVAFLGFLALISVNLGIINLLPLPVLDGGHLMYYFIELLTGKPVPEKIQEVGFRIGAALLFMLMSIAIFNDFTRL